jgi:hypothetical protein
MNCVIHSASDDGRSQILRPRDQAVLLTPLEMAELFDATKQNISLHLKNLFAEGALGPTATGPGILHILNRRQLRDTTPCQPLQPRRHPEAVHKELVALETTIQEARDTHNAFLQELGLPLLP